CGDAVPVPGEIPVYEDPAASLSSLQRLKSIRNLRLLLSSWDEPRRNGEINRAIDGGIGFIERIGGEVAGIIREDRTRDPAEITALVLAKIGLPPTAANPLVVRTILAHMDAVKGK
ncbi:MAG: MBL fold metallo-hydrolase, partial [Methanoregulaceae archaeon]|nr:MBL fold metallo-hydrolase [Methanoregulaceae archaeon]